MAELGSGTVVPKHTMSDWLERHDLTAELCKNLLGRISVPDKPASVSGHHPVDTAPDEIWQACGAILRAHVPGLSDAVAVALVKVRVDFQIPPTRYQEAFTLNDDGQGLPYAYIPWEGQIKDVLALTHEFGHVVQIIASAEHEVPPATREVCAFLSEAWACADLAQEAFPWAPDLVAFEALRVFRTMTVEAKLLAEALPYPECAYDYAWNYPLAQALVLGQGLSQTPSDLVQLFGGRMPLAGLIKR